MTSLLSEKILKNNQVCITFKTTYFEYKAKAATECPSNPWRFQADIYMYVYIYIYIYIIYICMYASMYIMMQ